jgi:hypothetical protein
MFANHQTPGGAYPSRPSVRSAVIWSALILSVAVVGLLLAPAPLVGQEHRATAHASHLNGPAQEAASFEPLQMQEANPLDHSVLNNPDILPAPNPAPLSIAAYD